MTATPAVRALIRENKAHQVYSIIQTSGKLGMRTMNQTLADLVRTGQVTFDTAISFTSEPEELKRIMQST